MSHKEIPVKVTAYVDEGIAPLVEALNRFPGVITIDSCQGDAPTAMESRVGTVSKRARVSFLHHDGAEATAVFAARLYQGIRLFYLAAFTLSVRWCETGDNHCVADLSMFPRLLSEFAATIHRVADEWEQ